MQPTTPLIVPCDFKEESFPALIYASDLAKRSGADLVLLHLAAKDDDMQAAATLMEKWKTRLGGHFNGKVEAIVQKGDIVTDIGSTAKRFQSELVVMPTHGMKGIQEITGSLALNVITESEVPFLIIQAESVKNQHPVMVIPVEYRSQLLEEISVFIRMAKLLSAEVHFFINERSPSSLPSKFLETLQQHFTEEGISVKLERTKQFDFSKATVDYATTVNAGIIAAINFSYENLYSINPRTDEEDLIYNSAHIPVLLVTPQNQDDDLAPSEYDGEE